MFRPQPVHLEAETVRQLLDLGANIKAAKEDGMPPLHWACKHGHPEVVKLLLVHGANIEEESADGIKPLHVASRNGNHDIVKLLLDKGANIRAAGKDGMTSLHLACKNGNQETVTLLLDHGANIDEENDDCLRPLHLACQHRHQEIVEQLLHRGAENVATRKKGMVTFLLLLLDKRGQKCEMVVVDRKEIKGRRSFFGSALLLFFTTLPVTALVFHLLWVSSKSKEDINTGASFSSQAVDPMLRSQINPRS